MPHGYITVRKSMELSGNVNLVGAKNAALPIMASLLMVSGISELKNVPYSSDILKMMYLMQSLGARVAFDRERKSLTIDTTDISSYAVGSDIMSSMRASILVMGPLLARFHKAHLALPGGCLIGPRPINYHVQGLQALGVTSEIRGKSLEVSWRSRAQLPWSRRIVLEYPSVGATENIMMFATSVEGITTIVNAALEPEVLDLVDVLSKMGAKILVGPGAVIQVEGGAPLSPIQHEIIPDRLEAGALLIAAAVTGGTISLDNARPDHLDSFLFKLQEMGHEIVIGQTTVLGGIARGVTLKATDDPQAVSLKTGPYPSFPTDLQPPFMAALTRARGTSVVEETVFENRLMQVQELQKMGAQISMQGTTATIRGVKELYGTDVLAHDIRGACALVLAGLQASGVTTITGLHHWWRAYDHLEKKLESLGAQIIPHEIGQNDDTGFIDQTLSARILLS